jgi:lysophospholipase
MTIDSKLKFTSESQLTSSFSNEIAHFWQQGRFDDFNGIDDIRINYAAFSQGDNEQCIVIVPGRCEGYLKYKEVAYDLYLQGYDIFIIDHRGQGLSERMLPNKFKGYVEKFDDYADDLNTFINKIVSKHFKDKPYILAHSMGGAIVVRYLQKYQDSVKASVISSPMIAINNGGFPSWLANFLVQTSYKLNRFLSDTPWYFLGQKDFSHPKFKDNRLMQSPLRYQQFVALYKTKPELQLGGVTIHWLNEAKKANQKIFAHIDMLNTPILVLQAGDDTVIDNSAQNKFCQQLHLHNPLLCPEGKSFRIEGARHELLFEKDCYRHLALEHIICWFKQY